MMYTGEHDELLKDEVNIHKLIVNKRYGKIYKK